MAQSAPGKAHREGITLMQLGDMFPDEDSARRWFESRVWPNGRCCPRCQSTRTREATHATMPYWCTDCRSYFSVKVGTVIEKSLVPLRKWAYAIYLHLTSLKGVSSMKLHRDLGVTQKTAWFMLQRIRKAFDHDDDDHPFGGPIEVDETYMGGKRSNMRKATRERLTGRGPVGKTAVVGAKDRPSNRVRAQVIDRPDTPTLHAFVEAIAAPGAVVFTDEATAYHGLPFRHAAVRHSAAEYVRDQVHTQGVESFWSTLKRAHKGVYHKFSPKHLHRYVADFATSHNVRELDTLAQMGTLAAGMVGKRLRYATLITPNGLPSGARSLA